MVRFISLVVAVLLAAAVGATTDALLDDALLLDDASASPHYEKKEEGAATSNLRSGFGLPGHHMEAKVKEVIDDLLNHHMVPLKQGTIEEKKTRTYATEAELIEGNNPTCTDNPPDWYDSDGPYYSCAWYSSGSSFCAWYGDGFKNQGTTANEACCTCGGGAPTSCTDKATALNSGKSTCQGCYKDLFAGRYNYCNGYYAGSTKTDCDWSGGSGGCTFIAERNVSAEECQQKCSDEPGCNYFTTYYDSICNLHLMESCTLITSEASGDVMELIRCPCTDKATVLNSGKSTCQGCYKDLFSGRYNYCDGYYAGSTKTDCDWSGGSGGCTFTAENNVSAEECQQKCSDEPGCNYFTTYYDSICNLHLMESCTLITSGASGDVMELIRCPSK